MKDKLTITVPIADRSIKMRVADGEEAFVREAAQLINERIDFYRAQPELKDIREILSRVALDSMVARLKGDAEMAEWQNLVFKKVDDLRNRMTLPDN
ncbi:MAG: cell division protein ZapA [Runella slithyformis]|jgi:cell division protein ZapA|nr:MAG: cell division protein ZapA [Runella slithyformis]TAF95999.1 MAG: cell division protein ZapA [Runella sp.]TAG19472.1 MAG: cell division protein ZapA [Cytophagales bacterium]TAG38753.1 MAG: cell division protein ZapA [Cytophagia bacterium]TAF02418.1 MAG: cell division protein ZapA [Runella slithyformis]